jgi:hypothetical protein
MPRGACLLGADRHEPQPQLAGAHEPARLHADRDVLTRHDGMRYVVDHGAPGALDDDVHVLVAILAMVVPHGLLTGGQIDLVEPEGRHAESPSQLLVEGLPAGCGPRSGSAEELSTITGDMTSRIPYGAPWPLRTPRPRLPPVAGRGPMPRGSRRIGW